MPEPPETQFPDVWSKLCNARRTNRLGHAYCLVGDDPQLLEAFGRRWARVCACRGDTENGDACGECRPCQQLENGVYPEFLELRPQSKSRQILVDQIRDFEHSLRLTTAAAAKFFTTSPDRTVILIRTLRTTPESSGSRPFVNSMSVTFSQMVNHSPSFLYSSLSLESL